MEAHRPKGNAPEKYEEAFNYYVGLGEKRTLQEVANKFTVSRQTVQNWSSKYNWQQRLKEIVVKANKQVEKKLIKSLAEYKGDCLEIVQTAIDLFKQRLGNKIKPNSMYDLKQLVELGLVLQDQPGEITEVRDTKYIAKVDANNRISITKSTQETE